MTEQIDFGNLIRRVLRQWFLILAISAIAAMLAGVVTSRMYRPQYQTQVLIAVYGKDGTGRATTEASETAQLFQEVISSNLLQKRVAEAIGMSYLPGRFSCSNIPNTNMITLSVSADTPQDAMLVINVFLDHYEVVTDQLMNDMVLQVLEAPKVPTSAVEAYNEVKILGMVFVGCACMLSGGLFLYFYLRDDIKHERQVEKKLDTRLFATIYHEDMKKGIRLPSFKKKKKTGLLVTNPVTSFGYIETFHKMCIRLEYATKQKEYKTILITSVQENEGKSTIAANLALSLADVGKKVLLVDLDLRKPAQFKLFEVPYRKGQAQVSNVISGTAKVENAIRKISRTNLFVLAGNRSYRNSTRLLIRETAAEAIKQMREKVDYVILDTPPLNLVADAEEVMRYADAGLIVVRQNSSITKDINDAIDVFKNTGCKLLGCVFNDVETGLLGSTVFRGESYSQRYGYGKYGRYGKRYEKKTE